MRRTDAARDEEDDVCGIAGWVGFDHDLRTQTRAVDAMTQTMACRGPDDEGTFVAPHAALGHRRLAIIDVEHGRQPMTYETPEGAVALVYSGEAYNFTELRAELAARGHRFVTDSDTEVVLHGYLEWGSAVAERLNGMFAFAVWDARDESLTLVRDRMGVKPLYYYETPDGVLFGSEPKAVLANPLARRRVTLDGLRELFAFVKTPGHAVWDGMAEVVPGTVVTLDRRGLRTSTYWRLETRPHTDSQEETVEHVRALLDDVVARQLVSDVPRCMLLSGGLDSSALTALAARQLAGQGEQVRSFAVDFVGQADNFVPDEMRGTPDAPYVHDVAALSGTEHRDIVLSSAELADPEVRRTVITARDLPAGLGDMDASLYLLFKAVRQHSTVALSGESADEVFGGYQQFFSPVAREADTFPWIALRTARRSDHDVATASMYEPGLRGRLDLQGYVKDSYRSALADVQPLEGETGLEARMREISHLHLTRFVRVLLDRKDRTSMATGLEVRVPFCDHRLVEYVYNAPWALKTYDGREKSLLRGATADVLPHSVVERVKSPYPSTQDPAYAAALRAQGRELLSQGDHAVFEIMDRDWLAHEVALSDNPTMFGRAGLERTLDLATWIEEYAPTLDLAG
ncbi:asparagine synthase (glutamine-hydrolysing) [Microlunatus sagamiharensis]|uniref:asparagine synthase (glutamine-hydrolyzing) n=1 Tax=Microlunatus sagamiharensis TaxID=546874 RepID=A0A1H2N1A9_9ACTN|nr:asparagine synthase (glutamine-hydrolyzing) [Microlunatus sagamiharensis]SDU98566.1 asparagine synthase (glutamine-hydrolysing) [Microlunatus sagamiharensis]